MLKLNSTVWVKQRDGKWTQQEVVSYTTKRWTLNSGDEINKTNLTRTVDRGYGNKQVSLTAPLVVAYP